MVHARHTSWVILISSLLGGQHQTHFLSNPNFFSWVVNARHTSWVILISSLSGGQCQTHSLSNPTLWGGQCQTHFLSNPIFFHCWVVNARYTSWIILISSRLGGQCQTHFLSNPNFFNLKTWKDEFSPNISQNVGHLMEVRSTHNHPITTSVVHNSYNYTIFWPVCTTGPL